jgi:putative endonuclease
VTEARRELGRAGEAAAQAYLRRRGVKILAANFRCAAGEIDLIGRDGDTIVFAEVKTRLSLAFGPPEMAVHIRKQRQIVRTAEWFLAERRLKDVSCRFDVLGITFPEADESPRIEWVRDAFPAEGLWVW